MRDSEVDVVAASLHIWGDLDCSGATDPDDAVLILSYMLGLDTAQGPGCPEIGSLLTIAAP